MKKIERCVYCDSPNIELLENDWPPMHFCHNCQDWVETYEDTDQLQRPDKVIS